MIGNKPPNPTTRPLILADAQGRALVGASTRFCLDASSLDLTIQAINGMNRQLRRLVSEAKKSARQDIGRIVGTLDGGQISPMFEHPPQNTQWSFRSLCRIQR